MPLRARDRTTDLLSGNGSATSRIPTALACSLRALLYSSIYFDLDAVADTMILIDVKLPHNTLQKRSISQHPLRINHERTRAILVFARRNISCLRVCNSTQSWANYDWGNA